MIVHLSPTEENRAESLHSLNFANGVMEIELGKSSVTKEAKSVNKAPLKKWKNQGSAVFSWYQFINYLFRIPLQDKSNHWRHT